jgi:hypothetical protein
MKAGTLRWFIIPLMLSSIGFLEGKEIKYSETQTPFLLFFLPDPVFFFGLGSVNINLSANQR